MANIFNIGAPRDQNQEATLYVGNLDPQVKFDLLWELFLQLGPLQKVYIPKDRVTGIHQGYGFVEYKSEEDADYAVKIMSHIKLFGRPLKINKAAKQEKQSEFDVGANIFVGNLDEEVDEKILYDTFAIFGNIIQTPIVMRDPESGKSLGYGFVHFDNFISSDSAVEKMHGQWLCGKQIKVRYKRKKGSKNVKDLHGSEAERLLSANNPLLFQFNDDKKKKKGKFKKYQKL